MALGFCSLTLMRRRASSTTTVPVSGSSTKAIRRLLALSPPAAAALSILVSTIAAQPSLAAQQRSDAAQPAAEDLRLNQSEGKLLHLSRRPASIFVVDPSIADVATPTDNAIFVVAKKPGHTSIFALGTDGQPIANWRVIVSVSDEDLRSLIRSKVGDYPVSLRMTTTGAILSGSVPTPNVAERVRTIAAEFVGSGGSIVDNLRVAGSLQVQLKVVVAEVSRSVSKELGIDWEAVGIAGTNVAVGLFTGRTFFDPSSGIPSLLGGSGPNVVARSATNAGSLLLGYNHGATHINSVIDALASESLLRELAEPTLVATSGEDAKFLAGGQFPIPSGQGLGQISIDYKNFGVSLDFRPVVVNEDLISIRVTPEVSALATDVSAGALSENGFTVPALTVRRVETTIELGSGQSFAIAGLLQDNISSIVSRYPGLGDIPILGALFRSTSFQRSETELIVIVTPTIVRPIQHPEEQRLPTTAVSVPSDLELLLRAKLSTVPRGSGALQRLETTRLHGDMGFEYE